MISAALLILALSVLIGAFAFFVAALKLAQLCDSYLRGPGTGGRRPKGRL